MNPIFIDVRESYEFSAGHVKGAINIPTGDLMNGAEALNNIPKDAPIIVYCRSGGRSNMAMKILRQQGFSDITNGINQEQVEANYLS